MATSYPGWLAFVAILAVATGQPAQAARLFGAAEAMREQHPGWRVVAVTLPVAKGRLAQVARLYGTDEATLERRAAAGGPNWRLRRPRAMATARAALGDSAFAEAQAAGRTLTAEAAIAEASALLGALSEPSPASRA
jgi:hypothetical protein